MMVEAEPHPSHFIIDYERKIMGVDHEMGSTGKREYCQNADQLAAAAAAAAASCEEDSRLIKRLRVASYEVCKQDEVLVAPPPNLVTPFPELQMSPTVVLDECCTPTRRRPSAELPPFFLSPRRFHDDDHTVVPLPAEQEDTTWIDYLLLQLGVASEEDGHLSPSPGATAKSYYEDAFFFLQEQSASQSPHPRQRREGTFNSTPTTLLVPPGCFVPVLLVPNNKRIDSCGTSLFSCGSTGTTNNNQKNNLKEGEEEAPRSAGAAAAAEAAAATSSSWGLLNCELLDERDTGDACPLTPRAVTPCRSIPLRVVEQQSSTTSLDPSPPGVLSPTTSPAKLEADSKDHPTLLTLTSFPFRILFVNEAFVALTGRNDLVGRSFFDTFDRGGAPPPSLAKSPDTLLNVFDIKDIVQVLVAAKNNKINNNNTQHHCVNSSSRKRRVLLGGTDDDDDTTSRMMNLIPCLIDVTGVESSSGELCNFAVKLSPLPLL